MNSRRLWGTPVAFASNMLLACVAYMLCRVVFVLENWSRFADGWPQLSLGRLFSGSLSFDIAALVYTNALYALLMLVPLHSKERAGWQTMARVVFVVVNALCVMANLCDCVYFQYTGRRTTSTVFREFAGESNLGRVFTAEMLNHWYLVLAAIALVALLWFGYRKGGGRTPVAGKRYYAVHTLCLLLYIPLAIIGIRGGVRSGIRPIGTGNANLYVNRPVEASIVLNTPFCIIRTFGRAVFTVPPYYADETAMAAVYTPVHPAQTDTLRRKNVMVIIVESMGREYIGALNATATGEQLPSYTPFVDSLCSQSLTFDYSFSNGLRSIDGMPSILSGIPMFVEPFVTTPQAVNRVGGLAEELADMGWHTAFFHGADNGSMGFQSFARATGFAEYYGRDEYNADPRFGGDADYDGTWAVWDEPFLQYVATQMGTFSEPFLSCVFTASSHHPFRVPGQYRDTFPDTDPNPIHKCIRYADHSLRRFFDTARRQPWYDNTLFVIVSDHSNHSSYRQYMGGLGVFCSPVIFFDPSGEMPRGRRHAIAQHIDVLPTVLGWTGTKRPFVAFGKDLLATPDTLTWSIDYWEGTYYYTEDSLLLLWDGTQTRSMHNFRTDWMMEHDLAGQHPRQAAMEQRVKAIIQQYMTRMTQNRLTVE